NNGSNGIDVEGNATLQFDGGTANDNEVNGVRLAWAASPLGTGPKHTLKALTATSNKNHGVVALNGQNLLLRGVKLVTNANYGLYYEYQGSSSLDVGISADPGGNQFGSNSSTIRDGKAGIYLCKSRGAATQEAENDTWSICAPTQMS